MSSKPLSSKRSIFYLFTSSFLKSFLGFSIITVTITSALLLYGFIASNKFADPLLDDSFNFSIFVRSLLPWVVLLSALYTLIAVVVKKNTMYVNVGSDGVEIERGLIIRKKEFIPYDSIQSIELQQSPLQRLLSFAHITLDYGSWMPKTIPYIDQSQAKRIQTFIARQATRI